MSSSGSYNFSLNRAQIVKAAFRKLKIFDIADTISAADMANGSEALNVMVKAWRAKGLFIYAREWDTVSLTASSIVLGSDGVDYECIRNHTSSADTCPVTGGEYMSYWKVLTTATGAAWVTATDYTSICNIDLDASVVGIEKAFLRKDTTDTIIQIVPQWEYFDYPGKTTEGRPTQLYFFRKPTPSIFLYPYPDSADDYVINLSLYRYGDDFDSASNTSPWGAEVTEAMIYGLANRLAPEYDESATYLKKIADEMFAVAKGFDEETGDTRFSPRFRQ